jgi:hypothetical protein
MGGVSWPWLALLVAAVALVVAAEWPRVNAAVGSDARRKRERQRRKSQLQVIVNEDVDEFEASVRRDLESLPTIEEPRTKRP